MFVHSFTVIKIAELYLKLFVWHNNRHSDGILIFPYISFFIMQNENENEKKSTAAKVQQVISDYNHLLNGSAKY